MRALSSTPAPGKFSFKKYEVITGTALRQTVLTGFLHGRAVADLIVVDIDENNGRRLRIYSFQGRTWAQSHEAALRPETLFIDIACIGGRDRLITYQPGRLSWFDLETKTDRALVAVTSSFNPPLRDEIPHVDLTHDINDDGLDDLVVPDVDGFWVFVQVGGDAFAEPVKIGPATDMSGIYGADGYRYNPWSQSLVHKVDYNRDDRSDLVYWNEDHFEVHTQDKQGLFAQGTETFTTNVEFDSDDLNTLATGDMQGRVLHSLAELNGDNISDFVVYSLWGESIPNKHSAYEVHFGMPKPDGSTLFAPEAGAVFKSDGSIQLGMHLHDLDQDGQAELMIKSIDLDFLQGSLWKSIKGFMGDDILLDLEFYRMAGGHYPDEPDAVRRIALDGVPSHRELGWVPLEIILRGGKHQSRRAESSWPRTFNTTLRLGDVTGDGVSDLIIGDHPRIMDVYVGVPGPELFVSLPQEVAIDIPNDEEYTWLVDLNKDGKQDILMHHTFTQRDAHGAQILPLGTEPHRVTILIAQ